MDDYPVTSAGWRFAGRQCGLLAVDMVWASVNLNAYLSSESRSVKSCVFICSKSLTRSGRERTMFSAFRVPSKASTSMCSIFSFTCRSVRIFLSSLAFKSRYEPDSGFCHIVFPLGMIDYLRTLFMICAVISRCNCSGLGNNCKAGCGLS